MRMLVFANKNMKEILRDPLNLFFTVGFVLILLLLLSIIQNNIPVKLFEIQSLAPGISVFGLSFLSLFCATIISKDRASLLLERLYTTPFKAVDFILGYTLPVVPIAVLQSVVCYAFSFFLGLEFDINIVYAVGFTVPCSMLYIAIGLLCGSVLNEKQVGGVCGALLTNLSAWLSGVWFDLELVGGTFRKIAYALPFVHCVDMQKAVVNGDFERVPEHLWWVLGYALVLLSLAVLMFIKQMKKSQ